MHVILTGATGLVGSAALAALLPLLPPNGPLTRLTILSRRPVPMATAANNPAITTILQNDFTSYPAPLLSQLQGDGPTAVIWALGISQREVPAAEYVRITKDYPLAAARAFRGLNGKDGVNFVHVSGEGATNSPGRFTPLYGRVKGEAEEALLALGREEDAEGRRLLRVYNARPGAVDPRGHAEVLGAGTWERKGAMLKVGDAVLMPAIRALYSGMHSPTGELGRVLVELAMGDGGPLTGKGVVGEEGRILSNVALRRLAGL